MNEPGVFLECDLGLAHWGVPEERGRTAALTALQGYTPGQPLSAAGRCSQSGRPEGSFPKLPLKGRSERSNTPPSEAAIR